ncbi:MAG: hypothetical protein HKL98_01600 [Burkholderiales bacterium]|nr:hypothetical protein [Burkholderiales bacterium]
MKRNHIIETITTICFLSAVLFVAFSGRKGKEKSEMELAKEKNQGNS